MGRKRSRSKAHVPPRAAPPPKPKPVPAPAGAPRQRPARALRALLLALALGLVAGTRALPMWLAATSQRAAFAYEAADGRTYPYLIGMDSYSWVRKAENVVAHGTPCDVETAEGCRDRLRHAPVGSAMPYASSLHVRAIAWLHRVLAWFHYGQPIDGSAFWVQVVVGTLGVVPAWLVGRRLGGTVAAFLAALLVGMSPAFLSRSLGADNDVWNVVLPLAAAGAVLRASAGDRRLARIAWAALGACVLAVHAAIWRGWTFGFVVLVAGLAASAVWRGVRAWRDGGRAALVAETTGPIVVLVVLVAGTLALTTAVARALPYETAVASAPARTSVEFPDNLRDVGELRSVTAERAGERLGGWLVVLGALAGVVVLLLPIRDREGDALEPRVVVAVWMAAALSMTADAQRWLLLAVAPIGLAYAGGAGRVVGLVRSRTRTPGVEWLVAAALATPVALAAYDGYTRARTAVPAMNDAWWESLRALERSAPSDAIVNASWPYGYWIQYVARRGATADGASVQTHVPYWMARALMSREADQTLGLLRMLDCGSDAWGEPEGRFGAYERLRAAGVEDLAAHDLVLELARVDRTAADRLLEGRGIDVDVRREILLATHCTPPPAYLMLSDKQARQPGIRRKGTWDPRRAAMAGRFRHLPEAEAVAAAGAQLGMPADQARTLLRTARGLRSEDDLDRFIAPAPGYFSSWVPCRREAGPLLVCDAAVRRREGVALERFTYPLTGDGRAVLRLREGGGTTERPPDALVVADAHDVRDLTGAAGDPDGWGVLVDARGSRAMFGPPYLIRSMLTRLVWLGRSLPGFDEVGDRRANGERVLTWRIGWP